MLYRIIYLGGIAGRGKGVESARRSAELFNKLHPHFMFLTTVSVLPDTKLYDQILLGEFVELRVKSEELITRHYLSFE